MEADFELNYACIPIRLFIAPRVGLEEGFLHLLMVFFDLGHGQHGCETLIEGGTKIILVSTNSCTCRRHENHIFQATLERNKPSKNHHKQWFIFWPKNSHGDHFSLAWTTAKTTGIEIHFSRLCSSGVKAKLCNIKAEEEQKNS